MPAAWDVGVACFGCDAMAMVYLLCLYCVPLLPSPPYCFERMATGRERLRCDTAMGGCLLRDAMAAGASCGFIEWGGGWAGCVLGMR